VLLVGIPVLGASAYFFAPSHVKEIVVNRFDISKVRDRDELTSGRNILWANGFQLFLESPLFGHGLATFIPLMKKNFHVYGNSHNDYLLYLVHYGVIGLGLFLMVLWSIFRESMHIVRHTSDAELRILSLSYFAGLSGYAVAMFGVNVIQPQFLFWVYTAVLLKYGRLVKPLEIESYGCQP
jgi:O-antigen ligase